MSALQKNSREVQAADVDVVACTELNCLLVNGLHVVVAKIMLVRANLRHI